MAKHTQPTPEELEQKINESIEEMEKNETEDQELTKKSEEMLEEHVEEIENPKEDSEETQEEQEEVNEKLKKEVEKETPEEKKEPDYKKKFSDSSRESLILYEKNKKMAEVIEKAGQDIEVTEEELKTEYPDWEDMTQLEQKLAKKDLIREKQMGALKEATREFRDIEVWNKKTDEFMADPETMIKFPELEGKEEDFKAFSAKSTHRGVDFAVLVSSFMYEEGKKQVKHKGGMMPTGSAGTEKSKPKSNKLSVEESRRLRTTDYKQYLELLKKGKIAEEV